MSSVAERKRRRAGRPRKTDAPRYPSGQTKHRDRGALEADAMMTALAARIRQGHAKAIADARDPRIAYPLGRAWRNGIITETQHEAGRILHERYARQLRAIDAPSPNARIADLEAIRGLPTELPPYLLMTWRAEWREIFDALKETTPDIGQETMRVCVFDHEPQCAQLLRSGLKKIILTLKL